MQMAQSVTELVLRLKQAVEFGVGEQSVTGEIGSFKRASSGHVYFTLKDSTSQLQCVLYRYAAAQCKAALREGLQVELKGKATVWEGRGALQFIVSQAKEAGLGSLQQQFEALKAKLAAEGLFDAERKKSLPEWPQSVGLITSASGAVIEDMRHRLEGRAPWMRAYLMPVLVQGSGAAEQIAAALQQWAEPQKYGLPQVDYLILARGGGSMEDLNAFNEEIVARAIAACPLPLISAVGHETDFTIADFVADLRAPTPTAAIELSTPDGLGLAAWLQDSKLQIRQKLRRALELAQMRLRLAKQSKLQSPAHIIAPFAQKLDEQEMRFLSLYRERLQASTHKLQLLQEQLHPRKLRQSLQQKIERLESIKTRMRMRIAHNLEQAQAKLSTLEARLSASSPQQALQRGFALVQDEKKQLLRDSKKIAQGSAIHITLAQGELEATVNKVRHPRRKISKK